jgi:hypothetical protein
MFENLNLLTEMKDFEDYYSSTLVPNATHVRNIRISPNDVSAEKVIRCLDICKNATSFAIYNNYFDSSFAPDEMDSTYATVVKMLEEGALNTIGMYSPGINEPSGTSHPSYVTKFTLLELILKSVGAKRALKRLDLAVYGHLRGGLYNRIRTEFSSLEALTIHGHLSPQSYDLWPLSGPVKWGQYANLQRLQFRDCYSVYVNRIPYLVRHFPSLVHILISACDTGHGGYNLKPEDWYE